MATHFNANANAPANANPSPPTNAKPRASIPGLSWPSWAPQEVTPILSYIFYGSLVVLAVFIILFIIHFTVYPIFSFKPGDPGIVSVPTSSDKQVDFTKAPAGNDISGQFTKIVPCGYTISMDLYLTGQFVQQTAPRIIMYNAMSRVTTSPTKTNLATTFPQANLVLWLDPALNDLYASVITLDTSGGTPSVQTTKPIVNVPMKSPFRVTYVYDQRFLEVYLNGYMETSMSFQHSPRGLSSAAPFFFGHLTSRSSCLVGNVAYWPRELSSREVTADGTPKSTVAFFNP
jgi:hypothetical protein